MALRHVGIRPLYSLTLIDFKKKIWEEEVTEKLWNLRTLNSGCGKSFEGYQLEMYDCIYCPYCDEYFSKDQWHEEPDREGVYESSRDSEQGGELHSLP